MRKILWVTVKQTDGFEYPNPLKLSELHLINDILNSSEVESVKVVKEEITNYRYKILFGE